MTFVKGLSSTSNQCPNCGNVLESVASNKCPYCESVIVTTNHDWVLAKKIVKNQRYE